MSAFFIFPIKTGKTIVKPKIEACPCGSGQQYTHCCLPFHTQQQKPITCEQLMRSRYSAFILRLGDYLFNTYHPDYIGNLTIEQLSEKSLDWRSLQIISAESLEKSGTVEFKAWYMEEGQLHYHHERSNFLKENDQWLYCDGTFYPEQKSGKILRNDICPCGSTKKFKKCCAKN